MSAHFYIDATHAPDLHSWVSSANEPTTDFPLQNLPFGRFRLGTHTDWRIGVAIGDAVLDLCAAGLVQSADMAQVLQLPLAARHALRHTLSRGLRTGSREQAHWAQHLYPLDSVTLGLPCEIRDYTDFYVGIHHATAVGKLFRPDQPLLPNYKYVPIGYHGRASTIYPSGQHFARPLGQIKAADREVPELKPTQKLDFELELGVIIGRPNRAAAPIPINEGEAHVFGLTLFNDWSARDVQAWEYQPLGPFLAKNFASTISPWIVSMEALAPFRRPFARAAGEPQPLPYLHAASDAANGALDIDLEVWLQTAAMRAAGQAAECISRSNYAEAAYWTLAQLVSHHTVGGCQLSAGDLLGTGTLSGATPQRAGSLLELSAGGKVPLQLSNGEQRTFLLDGDEVTLRASCEKTGYRRIGFGPCYARVLPAVHLA